MTASETDVTIDSIAAGGDGVARQDGLVIFVPRSAPGDRLRVRMDVRRRFARGRIVRVETPSAARVEPPCPHYVKDRCGGCQLQHLGYDAQLDAKASIIRDGIARIGKRTVSMPTVERSAAEWRYRTKLTLALRRRPDGSWMAGLHPYDDPARVFNLRDCLITREDILGTWRSVMAAPELLPHADALRGSVQEADAGHALAIVGGTSWRNARAMLDRVPSLASVWWATDDERPRLVASRADDARADIAFRQVNPVAAETLRSRVLERVRHYAPTSVVDAYAGVGETAIPLAEDGITVCAIELDRGASALCAARLAPGSRVITGRVEDELASALPADVVIVNPPRAGLDERVTTILEGASLKPRAIVYVSCDPATLGRDIARLPGYRVASLHAVDMFPQTAHVETVCTLEPEGGE